MQSSSHCFLADLWEGGAVLAEVMQCPWSDMDDGYRPGLYVLFSVTTTVVCCEL